MKRLLTDGGTPLDAMHMYAPMLERGIRVRYSTGPSTLSTEKNIQHTAINLQVSADANSIEYANELDSRCIERLLTLNQSFGARRRIGS